MLKPFFVASQAELEIMRAQSQSQRIEEDREEVKEDGDVFQFLCPHCKGGIITLKNETRCCIFRHAVLKQNYQQINPHTSKEECERLKEQDLVEGCCKPFRFVYSQPNNYVEKCDYI